MNKEELDAKIAAHGLWLLEDKAGQRLSLPGADLSGADLNGANLSGANLCCADLNGANLGFVCLRGSSFVSWGSA